VGFEPIRTERLILRPPRLSDAEAAYERRSLPEVARYQDWEMPYTRERADRSTAKATAMDGPVDGEGWSITVVDAAAPEDILGDLYVEIKWGGRCGTFGYTFHPDHWGRGYATEAAQAIVRYFFTDIGVSRVEASLHPGNTPSARVLEACGLIFEGLTRESFWVGDECSDDMLYGMTRADWDAWCNRPRHPPDQVELLPVTADNARAVGDLITHKSQERFVSTMLGNFRDALTPPLLDEVPLVPWVPSGRGRRSRRRLHHGGGDDRSPSQPVSVAVPRRPHASAPRDRLGRARPVRAVVHGVRGDEDRGVVGRGPRFTGTAVPGARL
jgi:RimJ/RimL family protein N-acetyltransferase